MSLQVIPWCLRIDRLSTFPMWLMTDPLNRRVFTPDNLQTLSRFRAVVPMFRA